MVVAGGIAVAGELLLPTDGVAGFVTRALALAAIPPALYAARFFRPGELLGRPPAAQGALNCRLNSSAASAQPLAAAREQRRADVLGVALGVVAGQHQRGDRAQP